MGTRAIQRSPAARTGWGLCLCLGLALSGSSGCCTVNRLADVLSHAHENRCTCQCPAPVVPGPLVAPPQGYLDQGPTLSGAVIAGPPGKSAVDVVVELQHEITSLTTEKEQLRGQLQQAEETIRIQEQALEAATQELQASTADLSSMQQRLTAWQSQLAEISTQYLDVQTDQDTAVVEMEQRLRKILKDCEADARTLHVDQATPAGPGPDVPPTEVIPSP